MARYSIPFLCFFLIVCVSKVFAQKEYDVIRTWYPYQSIAQNGIYQHFTNEGIAILNKRAASVQKITTEQDWKKRQKWIRKTFLEAIGPLPEKTPLNAKVTGTIPKEGFRVEHIVFESMPGFYVTSSLYIPESVTVNAPAIVYCSGHSATGYRSRAYQQAILNLVKKGFVVFAFDPFGQGERLEYPAGSPGKSLVGASTREHDLPGAQAFITGVSTARYLVWDGIRALDYLLTRKEVDPARIGMTGRSGGGTQTAMIGALDDRIYAAAPECYITRVSYMLQSNGAPDAEQNTINFIGNGLDKSDFLLARAPKPTLMITTTNDIFNIQGARDTYEEVARMYKALNKPGSFAMVEDIAVHASTLKNREAMYAFFQKNLKNPGSSKEDSVTFLKPEELRVTTTGLVVTALQSKTIFSIHSDYAAVLETKLRESRKDLPVHFKNVRQNAVALSGFKEPSKSDQPVLTGVLVKKGIRIEKYFIKGQGDYGIPYLLFLPEKFNSKAVLYISPKGKTSAIADGSVDSLVRSGFKVLVPDLIGTGETGPGQWLGGGYFQHTKMEGLSYDIWYAALLVGRSITGLRASDIVKLARILKSNGATEVGAVAGKISAQALLYAAAFTRDISHIALLEPYISYRALVTERFYNPDFIEGTVPAALQSYDIADLAASLAPRKLVLANATDAKGAALSQKDMDWELAFVHQSYTKRAAGGNVRIAIGMTREQVIQAFIKDWVN